MTGMSGGVRLVFGNRERGGAPKRGEHGFTFVEVMLSLVVLALFSATISGAVFSSLRAREAQRRGFMIDSAARSLMERLISHPADQLWGGSMLFDIEGESVRAYYYVEGVDLDGNGWDNSRAYKVRVVIEETELVTIMTDHRGMVKKL